MAKKSGKKKNINKKSNTDRGNTRPVFDKKNTIAEKKSPASPPARSLAAKLFPWLAPPVSGLLLVAGFPYYNIAILAWVALVPLLFTLRGRSTAVRLLQGYLFGVFFMGALFYWITLVRYPASIGYVSFVAVFPAIFAPWAALAGWALDREKPWSALLLPAAGWVALELAMSYGTFAFPWWSLAATQAVNLPVAQVAELTGMYGISFIVVMFNIFLFRAARRGLARHKVFWIACGAVFAAVIAFGIVSLTARDFGRRNAVKVALVQSDVSQDEKEDAIKRGISLEDMYRHYWEMTAKAVKEHKPDMVVWSESVLPIEMLTNEGYMPYTQANLAALDTTLVAGVYEGLHNSVIAITPEGDVVGQYDKMHLVPFGEFVPYRDLLGFAPKLREWIDTAVYTIDVEPGDHYQIFETAQGRFSAIICFESVFPDISRRMVREGAEFMFIVTNDAWFLRSPAAAQHIAMARLRAIENRRSVAQAAATGVSAVIDPRGRVLAGTKLMEERIISADMFPSDYETFYAHYGNVFGVVCVMFVAGYLVAVIFAGIRNKPKKSAKKK